MELLSDATYGRYFVGVVVSVCGVWGQNVAAAILMWQLTGSALLVGTVSIAQFVAPLVLAPWVGSLTDVFDRRRLLMGGRVISGSGALVLVLADRTASGITVGVLLGAILVLGLGLALSSPAMQALLPSLVPRSDLDTAIALNSTVGNLGRAVGPALGSGLIVLGGPGAAFGFAAFGHLFFMLMLWRLIPPTPRSASRGGLLDGFRYLRGDRKMALLLVGVGTLGIGMDPIITLTPGLAADLGRGDGAVGVLASVFGVGAVIAAGVLPRLRLRFTLPTLGFAGFVTLAAGLATVGAVPIYPIALGGFTVAGTGFLLATTVMTTRIQRRVPEELRGRIMALWTVAFIGSRPVGAALNGAVADLTSVRVALLVAAAVTLAAAVLARVRYDDGVAS